MYISNSVFSIFLTHSVSVEERSLQVSGLAEKSPRFTDTDTDRALRRDRLAEQEKACLSRRRVQDKARRCSYSVQRLK